MVMQKKRDMKILHIIAGAGTGGAETFCLDAIKALHDEGIKQAVISRPHRAYVAALAERGIAHYPMSFNPWLRWLQRRKVAGIIKKENPDLVQSWMNRAGRFTPHTPTVPVIGWFGGYYNLKNYAACDFFIGVTPDIRKHIAAQTGKPDAAYCVHTLGTLEQSPPVSRGDFGIPDDAPLVLLLSRMHKKKGVDLLLEAAKELHDVYFLLAGDGPEIENYKKLARALGVAERAIFPGWRDDRSALLDIADVCTLPSRYEPFGTVIAEAWSSGVPLVATRADGARQYVVDGENGLLVDIDDRAGLVAALRRALTDAKLRGKIMRGGRKTYNAQFSRKAVVASMLETYGDILQKFHRGDAD